METLTCEFYGQDMARCHIGSSILLPDVVNLDPQQDNTMLKRDMWRGCE
jgi:hypothetical protein